MERRTADDAGSITAPETTALAGSAAREYTLASVQTVSDTVRTTLGPRGKNKMIEQPDGSVLVTGDAATILDEVGVEAPAAALVVGAAEALGAERHDGTTTALVLGAALIAEAEALLDDGLHPNAVVRGYEHAERIARRDLDSLAEPASTDSDTATRIARTALTGVGTGAEAAALADLVVSAVDLVAADGTADADHVRVVTQAGGSTAASAVFDGVVLDDDPVRESMPASVEDATVLLTADSLQLDDTEQETSIRFEEADSFDRFVDRETAEIRALVESLVEMGVDVVLCSASIADEAQSALSVDDVLGIRRVDDEALRAAGAVLGGTVVSSVGEATPADLGAGGAVRGDEDDLYYVSGDGASRATVVLRGPGADLLADRERHVRRAVAVVTDGVGEPLVAGGGAVESALARRVRAAAPGVEGREQVAVEAFADALESVVRVLAENAGRDPLDTVLDLRRAHADGAHRTGIDETGTLRDTFEAGVVHPVGTVERVLSSATGAASTAVRVDDVLFVEDLTDDE